MIYVIAILVLLSGAVMLLRVRLRFHVANDQRLLFVGLGRSGSEVDFRTGTGVIKLFGLRIRAFSVSRKRRPPVPAEAAAEKEKRKGKKVRRVRSMTDIVAVLRQSAKPSWQYLADLVRSSSVEELEGNVVGGFESPDLTGQAYGWYQALTGAVPVLAGRFTYEPDWNGASFAGALRVSVGLPLYLLLFHSMLYTFRLPLRKIIKLAIGRKEGEQDVK
jgi:hypothetical protein